MEVNLRCFAGLSQQYECDFKEDTKVDMPDGSTVGHLLSSTGVPAREVKTVFLNGRIVHIEKNLRDGDRVALMPATGGM